MKLLGEILVCLIGLLLWTVGVHYMQPTVPSLQVLGKPIQERFVDADEVLQMAPATDAVAELRFSMPIHDLKRAP